MSSQSFCSPQIGSDRKPENANKFTGCGDSSVAWQSFPSQLKEIVIDTAAHENVDGSAERLDISSQEVLAVITESSQIDWDDKEYLRR